MKAKFKVAYAEAVEASMTITMNMSSWRRLRDQLAPGKFGHNKYIGMVYPANFLYNMISDMVRKLDKELSEVVSAED